MHRTFQVCLTSVFLSLPSLGLAQEEILQRSVELRQSNEQLLRELQEDLEMGTLGEEARKSIWESTQKLEELESWGSQLEAEKAALEQQKQSLERREAFFQTGFFASVGAIVFGVVGMLMRIPNARLDREYKPLQIAKLRAELDQA